MAEQHVEVRRERVEVVAVPGFNNYPETTHRRWHDNRPRRAPVSALSSYVRSAASHRRAPRARPRLGRCRTARSGHRFPPDGDVCHPSSPLDPLWTAGAVAIHAHGRPSDRPGFNNARAQAAPPSLPGKCPEAAGNRCAASPTTRLIPCAGTWRVRGCLRRVEYRRRWTLLNDRTTVEEADPVRHVAGERHLVRGGTPERGLTRHRPGHERRSPGYGRVRAR